ncbi:thioredoxin family protein [Blastococcus sp. CT_GayMR19]|uniref:glutaredoxin family protein n=1 Tax=Blastococcus sp. CT_GayMR19 TaxID=2559608 RepID=UPI0010746A98|nr:thioredoxin family protein [Blastococcus sp. CT_GayMR19]TFV79395.1 thioredoxin family protein [Blastococcus sp. CT_GayMR19]
MTAITLLTQRSCAYCEQAKATLNQLRREHVFEAVEVSLETDEGRELGARHGVLFAPGVLVDGQLFSFGRLSERKLRRELQRRHAAAASPGPSA